MGAMAYQITSLIIVYSTVYWVEDQRKHQSSTSLAFVWGIHRRPVNSPHKGPVTWKTFPFDDVIMFIICGGNPSVTAGFFSQRVRCSRLWCLVCCQLIEKTTIATGYLRRLIDFVPCLKCLKWTELIQHGASYFVIILHNMYLQES